MKGEKGKKTVFTLCYWLNNGNIYYFGIDVELARAVGEDRVETFCNGRVGASFSVKCFCVENDLHTMKTWIKSEFGEETYEILRPW